MFNKNSVKAISKEIKSNYSGFPDKEFCKDINLTLENFELKDRVRLIAQMLNKYLTNNYKRNITILLKTLHPEEILPDDGDWERKDEKGMNGFMLWPLTQYIEDFGLDHYNESMHAMYELTKRFSSEWAIRPFLKHYEKDTFKELTKWKKDPSLNVRRLVSEGTRPRLPWGMKVDSINENLKRNIKLIYSLRCDDSLYVRRSVANHLNDISYIDENLFLETLKKMGTSQKEQWVKRHATRSLLKKGHPSALEMHGYSPKIKVKASFKISEKSIYEGDSFLLDLKISSRMKENKKLLIEYLIHYPKKNGKYSPKPFRLKDTHIESELQIHKKIHFKKVTTRAHYPGEHFLEIQINGQKYGKISFELKIK